jgi:Uma2 family endonuclease
MERKFDLYRRAGVREYWVVSPENENIHAYRFREGKTSVKIYEADDVILPEILPGLEIPLELVFAE